MDTPSILNVTEVALRDGHQSLLATRMRIADLLPIAEKMDKIGYWSMETWGGATFDACVRYLGEDPWERLRQLKAAMPNTPQQMLLRGQNLLGYRHYADDVVEAFVERAVANGMDVFRIFDAMNDVRNLTTAVKAVVARERHAQGTISYTVSPVHTTDMWVDMGRRLEDMGCHSICIKDMAGLLRPYAAEELVGRLKEVCDVPIALHCHATTGLSTASILKAVEAGLDMVDTSISSMSMTYGHSSTEAVVAIFQGQQRDTGLNLESLEEIAGDCRKVRAKYAEFEGMLRGTDSRILVAQVPGGMLTNMEGQLKEQGALDRMDEVLTEIPKVRVDLGYIPLVTPTSQIVGTQAVINVLSGERYATITKETQGILKGEYGKTAAPVNAELLAKVLNDGEQPITCRPADNIAPELDAHEQEFVELMAGKSLKSDNVREDFLIHALFPQVGLKFLENRNNPAAFEPAPGVAAKPVAVVEDVSRPALGTEHYSVSVDGKQYAVEVSPGDGLAITESREPVAAQPAAAPLPSGGCEVKAPLAGNVYLLKVREGDVVQDGDVVMVMEAMKMETEVRTSAAGTIAKIFVREGDSIQVGQPLMSVN